MKTILNFIKNLYLLPLKIILVISIFTLGLLFYCYNLPIMLVSKKHRKKIKKKIDFSIKHLKNNDDKK